jgi:hypothetical protein
MTARVAPAVDSKNAMQDCSLMTSRAACLENGTQLKAGAME